MVLKQSGIFPSPMGEDRISKFVRTLEILGEGRRKVESGILQWKVESGKWKMVLNEPCAKQTSPCHSERLCAGMSCCATPAPATEESSGFWQGWSEQMRTECRPCEQHDEALFFARKTKAK